jgi:hypothetical protein
MPRQYTRQIRPIEIPIGPSIAYVPLTQGQFALIDREDAEWVGQWNWAASWIPKQATYYAQRHCFRYGKNTSVTLHTSVLLPDRGFTTDHVVPGNGLDCRKSNLRQATLAQQSANRRLGRNNTSGLKGVTWDKWAKRWKAHCRVNGKERHLGHYLDKYEAKRAYDSCVLENHGEFARL